MKRLSILAALALADCATIPASAGPTAGLGQVASIENVRIRPLEVLEDSRCPINAVCVWAGRIRIRASLSIHGLDAAMIRELTLREPVAVFDGTLTLVEAAPNKIADQPIEAGDYRFTFRFDRRP